jgi:transcription termination factor NusB
MNEELTRVFEKYELEAMIEYYKNNDCSRRVARELATALLAEMDKPKVWGGAPEDAIQAQITWFTENGGFTGIKTFTRELPKTRARQIAENIVRGINDEIYSDPKDIEYVEGVLKRYAEELKGEA